MGDALISGLIDCIGTEAYVRLDVGHDLRQPFDPIGFDPIILDGLVDPVLHHFDGFDADRFFRMRRSRNSLGYGVERRNAEKHVGAVGFEIILDTVRNDIFQFDKLKDIRILQIRHDDTGLVDNGDGLRFILGLEHDEDHQHIHQGEEDRNAESNQEKRFFPDFVIVFTLNDDTEFLEIHIRRPP